MGCKSSALPLPEKWARNCGVIITVWNSSRFMLNYCADRKSNTPTLPTKTLLFLLFLGTWKISQNYRVLFLERSKSSREKNTSGPLMSKVWHFIARSDPISWSPYLLSVTFGHSTKCHVWIIIIFKHHTRLLVLVVVASNVTLRTLSSYA